MMDIVNYIIFIYLRHQYFHTIKCALSHQHKYLVEPKIYLCWGPSVLWALCVGLLKLPLWICILLLLKFYIFLCLLTHRGNALVFKGHKKVVAGTTRYNFQGSLHILPASLTSCQCPHHNTSTAFFYDFS